MERQLGLMELTSDLVKNNLATLAGNNGYSILPKADDASFPPPPPGRGPGPSGPPGAFFAPLGPPLAWRTALFLRRTLSQRTALDLRTCWRSPSAKGHLHAQQLRIAPGLELRLLFASQDGHDRGGLLLMHRNRFSPGLLRIDRGFVKFLILLDGIIRHGLHFYHLCIGQADVVLHRRQPRWFRFRGHWIRPRNLWITGSLGLHRRECLSFCELPTISADGKEVVFRTWGKDEMGLRIIDVDTHKIRVLTTALDNLPEWSPTEVELYSHVNRTITSISTSSSPTELTCSA